MRKTFLGLIAGILLVGCAPLLQDYTVVLTVDNTKCTGTYRTVYVYRNNVIIGQVTGYPKKILSIPVGSADFKAVPMVGNSQPIFKSIKIAQDTVWNICE